MSKKPQDLSDISALSRDLNKSAIELIQSILEKHTSAMLSTIKELATAELDTSNATVTLSIKQLRGVIDTINPDGLDNDAGLDQQDTYVTFFYRKEDEVALSGEHLPKGQYYYIDEYPEDGCYGPL